MKNATIILSLLLACTVEDVGPPPVAGAGPCPFGSGSCPSDEESSSTDAPPEREPELLPDDDIDLVAKPHVVGAAYSPTAYIAEFSDKCCPTGGYGLCVDDVNNSCGAGKTLTACYGCDFANPGDTCSTSFQSNTWESQGGSNYKCTGLSFVKATGVMVHDHCSYDGPAGNCVPWSDAGVANYSEVGGDDYPNGCPDYAAKAVWTFDGAIGRMCCRSGVGGSPTGYACVPVEAGDSCSGQSPHTISSFCMPCTAEVGTGWDDPDGTGTNNTRGAWDLLGTTTGQEEAGSIYCGNGSNDTMPEANLPDWTGDVYKKMEYICRGVQVNAVNGLVQSDLCD